MSISVRLYLNPRDDGPRVRVAHPEWHDVAVLDGALRSGESLVEALNACRVECGDWSVYSVAPELLHPEGKWLLSQC